MPSFKIGKMTIPAMIITPITPTAFFKTLPQPMMLSTESPKIFPTTGIKFETAAFAVFAVIPSTELLSVPSIDNEQTKMVKTMPKIHTIEDFKNFDNRSICILSEMFEIMPSVMEMSNIGMRKFEIKFPMKLIINKMIGWIIPVVVMQPVVSISVDNSGISKFIKLTISWMESRVKSITETKLSVMSVTMIKYWIK